MPGLGHHQLQRFRAAGNKGGPLVGVDCPEDTEVVATNFCTKCDTHFSRITINTGAYMKKAFGPSE
jgi:hypothetical protein